jgi:sortase A
VRNGRALAGLLLVVGGAAALGWAGVDSARAAMARDRARAAWDAREARRAVLASSELPDLAPSRSFPPAPGAPVARLRIPRLGLDEVVVEGVDDDALAAGPGHMPSTPLPGIAGNSVLSAHRDRHFRALDEVAIGDTVVTDSDAGRVTWVVTGRRIVTRDARAIKPTADAVLTLTTCWPVRFLGPAPDRLLLTARPVRALARR